MQRKSAVGWLCGLALVLLPGVAGADGASQPAALRAAGDDNRPPYVIRNDDGELRKLDKKIAETPSRLVAYARDSVVLALVVAGTGLALFGWNLTLRRRVAARTRELERALNTLERATAAEKDARASLTATLQAIPDLLFEIDREHRYVDVFTSSERLLYAPKGEMVGRRVSEVLPGDAAATVDAAIDAALAQGADYGRVIALDGDGEPRWFELSVTRKGQGETASVVMLSRDISARRQAAEALLAARETSLQAERDRLFRTLFDAMPVAVTFVQDENIVFVSRRFSQLFGYSPTDLEVLDDWWPRAYPDPHYRAEVRERWAAACTAAAAAADGRIEALEYRIAGADGEQRDVLVGGQFVEDGMLVTFTEITSQKQAEAALRQARDAAQAASLAKSAFLANMSHEIRTPLNAIIGLSTLLARAIDNPAQRDRVGKVLAAGQHLLGIINAILDLSKIEAGKFTLDAVPLRIETIVHNVVAMLGERAREKRIELRSELPALPATRSSSPSRDASPSASQRSKRTPRARGCASRSKTPASASPTMCCRASSPRSSRAITRPPDATAAAGSDWRSRARSRS